MEEELTKALELWFDYLSKGFKPIESLELSKDKIKFMLEYNPKSVSASDSEKEYHDFWNKVIYWLDFLTVKLDV